jgi:hypothetical protein
LQGRIAKPIRAAFALGVGGNSIPEGLHCVGNENADAQNHQSSYDRGKHSEFPLGPPEVRAVCTAQSKLNR